jgi:hypothetical protein
MGGEMTQILYAHINKIKIFLNTSVERLVTKTTP